jgi:hypothetical protein
VTGLGLDLQVELGANVKRVRVPRLGAPLITRQTVHHELIVTGVAESSTHVHGDVGAGEELDGEESEADHLMRKSDGTN